MDAGPVKVISELFEAYRGKPMLVIGGGPSVKEDLPHLSGFQPALVLSANEHGCRQDRFPVDYIVHCDKMHCEHKVSMVEYLRPFGKPLISKWASADVRLEDWRFGANSGVTAVAVAAVLGGSPIVVTGLDFWRSGRHYFHTPPTPTRVRRGVPRPVLRADDKTLNPLAQFVGSAHIRALSGLMAKRWPLYRADETFGPPPALDYCRRNFQTREYRTTRSFHWSVRDTVAAKTVIKLSKSEAAILLREGKVVAIDPPV